MSVDYDVVVAGAGPAGLAAARAAARHGARVLVCEREAAVGIPTRTSGGSFLRSLRALGVPDRLSHPVREVRFVGPAASARVRLADDVVCVLDVRALYQWLAQEAAAAGAEIALRTTVAGASADSSGVTVRLRRGEALGGDRAVRAAWAVDATGTAAVLAAGSGLHPAHRRRGVGAEVDLAAPAFPADVCVLAMGRALAPGGYAWAFPYREGRVRLGVGVIAPDAGGVDPRTLLDGARRLPALAPLLAGAQPLELHAGLIPAEPLRRRIVGQRLLCLGDAAAHASTLVGEGIRYAIAAGDAGGAAVAAAAACGDDAPARRFERDWRRRHERDLAIAWRLNRRICGFDDRQWDDAIETLARTPTWFLVAALASDFRPTLLLRLAATHPGLGLRMLRAARAGAVGVA